jgi:uncharacterized protein YkwD
MKTNFLLTGFLSLGSLISLGSFSTFPVTGLDDDVLKYTNEFRKSKRLPGLIIREELSVIARKHSQNMAKGRVAFGHDGFNLRYNEARKAIRGLNTFAENVAFGFSSGKDVVAMWKNSPGHRKNMLGQYRYIGIGTAKDRRGNIYYTEVFAN